MNFEVSTTRFGVYEDSEIGKGFKILSKEGFIKDINNSSLYRIFQLPNGVEQFDENKYIFRVDYIVSDKSGLKLLFISIYHFTKLDSDNRMCYEAINLAFKVNEKYIADFNCIEEAMKKIDKNGSKLSEEVFSSTPYRMELPEFMDNSILFCRTSNNDIYKGGTITFLMYSYFMFFKNRKTVIFTDDSSLINLIQERYTTADISMISGYDEHSDPVVQIRSAISEAKNELKIEIEEGEKKKAQLGREKEELKKSNEQLKKENNELIKLNDELKKIQSNADTELKTSLVILKKVNDSINSILHTTRQFER